MYAIRRRKSVRNFLQILRISPKNIYRVYVELFLLVVRRRDPALQWKVELRSDSLDRLSISGRLLWLKWNCCASNGAYKQKSSREKWNIKHNNDCEWTAENIFLRIRCDDVIAHKNSVSYCMEPSWTSCVTTPTMRLRPYNSISMTSSPKRALRPTRDVVIRQRVA